MVSVIGLYNTPLAGEHGSVNKLRANNKLPSRARHYWHAKKEHLPNSVRKRAGTLLWAIKIPSFITSEFGYWRAKETGRIQFMTFVKPFNTIQDSSLAIQDSIQTICADPGPFVTVFLPAIHPGAAEHPLAGRLKTILGKAEEELKLRRYQGPIDELLKPLEELAADPNATAGTAASVVYLSPTIAVQYMLPMPTEERVVVASHPHITPLLPHLMPKEDCYVLAIDKQLVRLGRLLEGECTEIPLPEGVPASFEADLVYGKPDHDLQNHSGSTQFGTGSERDEVHARLSQYFRRVDRELHKSLKSATLIVIGLAEEVAAYRAESATLNLLDLKTSSTRLTWFELGKLATGVVMDAKRITAEKALKECQETPRRDHVLEGIRPALEASLAGRIHKLLLATDAEHIGLLGPSFPTDSTRLEGKQDLINATAVETIRKHGEVFMVDGLQLGTEPCAAILRY